jgi:hypothetical protein
VEEAIMPRFLPGSGNGVLSILSLVESAVEVAWYLGTGELIEDFKDLVGLNDEDDEYDEDDEEEDDEDD